MRNKFGAAALCLLLAAVLYATEHGGVNQAAVALKGDAVAALRAMGVQTLIAPVAPDQTPQSLSSELPAHDPTVGRLAGSAATSGGAATYSIPIAMPPGRRGMQPSLSLDYNSRSGNGIAGMGWSLSGLSSLHRCPSTLEQDGSVAAVSLTNADKLCLDGQRLVAKSGSYGQPNTTYDTELDSFVRVTQLGGDLTSASTYFEVETKDGDILWYGNNSSAANPARVVPGGVTPPLSWLIERKEDRVGNFIHYLYTSYGNGEVLVNSIVYTGFGTTDGNRHVDFVYQARPVSTTSLANDASTSYIAGGLTMQTQRLATVTSYYGTQMVHQYQLDYGTAPSAYTGRSLLRGVTDCAFADGSTTPVCRPETKFTWQESAVQSNFHALSLQDSNNDLPTQAMTALYPIGDMDGDGVPELVAQYYDTSTGANDNYIVSLNADGTVKGIIPPSAGVPTPPTIPPSDYNAVFPLLTDYQTIRGVDFNKDGRIDIVSVQGTRAIDTMWNGTTTAITASAFSTYDLGVSLPQNVVMIQVGDFNGDGFNDLMVVAGGYGVPSTLYVYLGQPGPSPGVPSLQSAPAFTMALPYVTNAADGAILSYIPTQVVDFDGDGMADVILERPWEYTVNTTNDGHTPIEHDRPMMLWFSRVNNGAYTLGTGTGNAYNSFAAFGASSLDADETNQEAFTRMIDVNGDGLPDLVSIEPQTNPSTGQLQGYWSVRLNNGGHFGPRMVTSSSRGIESCAAVDSTVYAWGQCSDRWDPTFAPLLSSGNTAHDGRSEMLVPRAFAARICDRESNDKNGETVWTYWCPQNPADGDPGVNEAQEGGIYPRQLPGGSDIYHPLYQGGSAAMPDGSAYFMDALHFVQTSPTTMDVEVVNTSKVYSALATAIVDSSMLDLYGRGMLDSFAPVGVAEPPGTLPNVDFTSWPFVASGDPTWGPTTLPDGTTSVGKFKSLFWENFVSQDLGTGLSPDGMTPEQPDVMSSVTDGLGAQTTWTYYPLSSAAGRTSSETPLYAIPSDPAQRYADNANVYFTSSMPVVSDMTASDGVGGTHAWRYGYSQAMYNTQGRGFQGFRTIIEEDLTSGLRTTTTFDQKFPLAGKVVDVVVNAMANSGTAAPIRHETYTWLCDRSDRTDTSACTPQNGNAVVKFPFLDEHDTTTYDATVALQAGGAPQAIGLVQDINASDTNCGGTIATTSGYDVHGNLVGHVVLASDLGTGAGGFRAFVTQRCVYTIASYTATTSNWWLDELNSTTVISKIAYNATNHPLPSGTSNPIQKVVTGYTWNADRTLLTETVQSGVTAAAGYTDQQKATAYAYPTPSYGLPSAVAVVAAGDVDANGQRTRTSSITYSADGYFPAITTNTLGQTTQTMIAARDGQPTLTVDANGLGTTMSYDPFGQLVLTQYHGLSDPAREPDRQTALTWCHACAGMANAVLQSTTVQDGAPTTITTLDLYGRTILAGHRQQDGSLSLVQTQYDALGRVQQQSIPYTTVAGQYWTTYLYDPTGRMTQKIVPRAANDGRGDEVTTYTYSGEQTAIEVCGTLDPDGSKCLNMTRTTDSLGKYMETVDAQGGVTQYWLDPMDDTLALEDANGTITQAAYNAIGQRTSVSDPNQGTWNFVYDALGELLTQTDARGVVTTTTYDPLSRPLTRSASIDVTGDGVPDTVVDSWTYDPTNGIGETGSSQRMVYPSGVIANGAPERSQTYLYDSLARLSETDTTQQIAAGSTKSYVETLAYDSYYGWPKSIGYPNGEGVGTYYSKYGQPIADFNADPHDTTAYRSVTAVDARGNPTAALLGAASVSASTGLLTDTRTYRTRTGELMSITYAGGATNRRLNYLYDVFGNLMRQNLNSNATVENFTYDPLMRMTSATRTGAVNAAVTYAYDAVGNFTSKSDFSSTTPSAYTYTGGTCGGGANAVKSVALSTGGTRTYCYDADGNLTSDNAGLAVSYDHDNLPIKTTRGSATINLYYGPDNLHTREVGSDGTKVYLDGGYEDWISAGSTKVYVGSEAEITNNGSTRTVNYLLTDRLGSVDSIADSTGTLIETRGSDAFGKPRSGTWADLSPPQLQSTSITARGFTEHEHLNSVQLIHMNGRVYDYQLGRFFSVDPIIQAPLNSQSLNPYSYIMNNPLAGTDPTGYDSVVCSGSTLEGCSSTAASMEGFTSASVNEFFGGADLGGKQTSNGAQGQTTSTQTTTAQATPSATPSPSWCPNCQFKSDPSSIAAGASGQRPSVLSSAGRFLADGLDTLSQDLMQLGPEPGMLAVPEMELGAGELRTLSGDVEVAGSEAGRAVEGAAGTAPPIPAPMPLAEDAATAAAKTPGQLGKEGEAAVRSAYDIGDKAKLTINGRIRIPDGLNPFVRSLSEVKNVDSLSFTQQLRDYLEYAQNQGFRFDLYTRPNTQLSGPLQNIIDSGRINLLHIP